GNIRPAARVSPGRADGNTIPMPMQVWTVDRTMGINTTIKHPGSPTEGGGAAGAFRILNPGRNCSGAPLARRGAVLVEGDACFRPLEDALRLAERTIFIVGWDFDAAIKRRVESDETAPRIGDLLRTLVEERAALEVRILVWNLSTIYAPGALLPLLRDTPWEM